MACSESKLRGCAHCDALMGRFFEHDAEPDEVPAVSLKIALTPRWKTALYEHGWNETLWVSDLHLPNVG